MDNKELCKLRLNEAMRDIDITAQELADRSGINKGTISHYVHGQNAVTSVNATKMSAVLGVSAPWLMGLPVPKLIIEEVKPDPLMERMKVYMRLMSDVDRKKVEEYAEMLAKKGEKS